MKACQNLHQKVRESSFFCVFVWFDALRPSQQLWSYRDSQFT